MHICTQQQKCIVLAVHVRYVHVAVTTKIVYINMHVATRVEFYIVMKKSSSCCEGYILRRRSTYMYTFGYRMSLLIGVFQCPHLYLQVLFANKLMIVLCVCVYPHMGTHLQLTIASECHGDQHFLLFNESLQLHRGGNYCFLKESLPQWICALQWLSNESIYYGETTYWIEVEILPFQ